jgi:hypothetical protein
MASWLADPVRVECFNAWQSNPKVRIAISVYVTAKGVAREAKLVRCAGELTGANVDPLESFK